MSRKSSRRPPPKPMITQTVIHPDAAGIDLAFEVHYVAVPVDRDPQPVRNMMNDTRSARRMSGHGSNGCFGGRGGRLITSPSFGSTACEKAKPRVGEFPDASGKDQRVQTVEGGGKSIQPLFRLIAKPWFPSSKRR